MTRTIKQLEEMKLKSVLFIIIVLFAFVVGAVAGVVAGISLGIKAGQMILFEGLNTALEGSNINFTIDINETAMVDRVTHNLEPFLNKTVLENRT
jgi:diacylglycerol kinase